MPRLLLVSIIIYSWVIAPCLSAAPTLPPKLDQYLRDLVANGYCPGIAIGIIDADASAFFNYGKLGTTEAAKVNATTIFEIGSITKVFTTTLLADLVRRGKLKLDDPISAYLPEQVKIPIWKQQVITLGHLANHSSGLPRMPDNFAPKAADDPYVDYHHQQLYNFLSSYTLPRAIGSRYEYSNLGMGLLGHILARHSGQSYEKLVRQRICKPLHLEDTVIILSPEQRRRLAKGHHQSGMVRNWHFDCLAGCGALRSTSRDLLKFVAANMGRHQCDIYPAMQLAHRGRFKAYPYIHVALGWLVLSKYDREIIWHNGGTGGYRSFCGFTADNQRGVVVLTNSSHSVDAIGLHILDESYTLPTLPERKKSPTPRAAITVAAAVLQKYIGEYQLTPEAIFTVKLENGQLWVRLTNQPSFPVFAETPSKFFYKVVDAQITFVTDKQGQVTGLVLHQGGRNYSAPRRK